MRKHKSQNSKSGEYHLGHIWSRDASRPIACEEKYLMDYNAQYFLFINRL